MIRIGGQFGNNIYVLRKLKLLITYVLSYLKTGQVIRAIKTIM